MKWVGYYPTVPRTKQFLLAFQKCRKQTKFIEVYLSEMNYF